MRYLVSVPISGVAIVEVDALTETGAKKQALETVTLDNVEEWQAVSHIVQGIIFYGLQNEIEVELIED